MEQLIEYAHNDYAGTIPVVLPENKSVKYIKDAKYVIV